MTMRLTDPQTIRNRTVEIGRFSPQYPSEWNSLSDAPERVYALGNLSLLSEKKFAVVGSRRTPQNALKLGEDIAKALSERFVLVTGTADGGDSAAIEGGLRGSGKIICISAGGFSALPQYNLSLLEKVLSRGLLLSPYPFETGVRAYSYEYRNKLLAKLSCGALVLGAGEKSGALITANYAKEEGKPLFALPYPANSFSGCGCNALIKGGARLTESADDIFDAYGLEKREETKELLLSAEERRAYEWLKDNLSAHITEIAAATGIPVYKIRSVLTALEVKGAILSTGGNGYTVV